MAKKVTVQDLNRKLDRIISTQKKLMKEEKAVHAEEKLLHKEEAEEMRKLKELEKYEKELVEAVGEHPLRNITFKDIAKGIVGAFIGVGAHYTFVYGVKVAAEIDVFRATLLFPISYAFGGIFMYLTGFRRIKDPKLMAFLPLRLTILYIVAVLTAMLTLLLFNPEFFYDFWMTYKQVATVTLSAVIGACTADLIGKE
jgi:uncharacterized membrane protein